MAIKRRTIFESDGNTIEFVRRSDINRGGTGKAYRVILNGKAVDWAYDDCHSVETIKTAEYFFSKHI